MKYPYIGQLFYTYTKVVPNKDTHFIVVLGLSKSVNVVAGAKKGRQWL
jgi:hypothetical protein